MILPPAINPCGSCPYRRDVPSGLWDESEYLKLPPYDGETWEQLGHGVFMCHQQDGRMCAGWTAVHDMYESFALRIAVGQGAVSPEDLDAILDYTTAVPLFASGTEAALHGLRDIRDPSPEAIAAARRLKRKIGR